MSTPGVWSEGHALLEKLQSLDRVNRIVQRADSPMTLLRDVLDAVLQILDCDRAYLLRPCDPEAAEWFIPIERTTPSFPGVFATGTGLPMDAPTAAVFRRLLASPEPLHFGPGATPMPDTLPIETFQVRAMIMIALQPKGDTAYAFGLHRCARAEIWSAPEIRLFDEIGRRLEDALGTLLLLRRLRDSEAKLETAQQIAHLGYWERDFETNSVTLSAETCRILGWPSELVMPLDRWLAAWHGVLHPDDLVVTETALRRALGGGPRYDIECRIIRADGQHRILHAQGDTDRGDGKRVQRMFGVVQDITERRVAEVALRERDARFRAIVDHATDGFFLFDDEMRIVDVNRSVCENLGYSREELVGTHPSVFDPNASAALLGKISQTLLADASITFESVHRRKDGSQYPVEVRIRRFEESNQNFGVALARDITERVTAEALLRRSEEQLRQSQKLEAIGQLAGGVAHDFNNILAVMMMQTELALGESDLASVRESLAEIRTATERASSLTRQLLVFGRRQVIQLREVDLGEIVTNVAKMLRRIIGEDVELELVLYGGPLIVSADASMLDQIVMNLAVNARDAMPHGGILRIETGEVQTPAPRAWLEVSDTGDGISAAVLPHIFEPFFTTKEIGKGTGLGLSTVFGIVHQHGGELDVRSRPGSTTFRVALPALPLRRVEPAGERERPRGGSETILVVEDDDILRVSMKRALGRHGYRVLVAANAVEALAIWRERAEPIQLLFTDMVMPGGMGGYELSRALRTDEPTLKVIFVSGYSPESAGKELHLNAGETFLEKPVSTHVLLETVRSALDC